MGPIPPLALEQAGGSAIITLRVPFFIRNCPECRY